MPVKVERWECVVCHQIFVYCGEAQSCERRHRPPGVKALGRDISIQMQGRGFILCGPDSAKGNTVSLILGDLEIAGLIQFVEEHKTQGECTNNPLEKKHAD